MSGSLVRSIGLAALPALAVLALLWRGDRIALEAALLLALAVLLGTGIAVRRRLAAEKQVMQRLNRLTREAQSQLDALSHKAAMADRIIASLPDPLFFLDQDRRVVRANSVAHALVDTNLTGRDIADGLRDPLLLAAIDRAIGEGIPQTVDLEIPVPVESAFIARIEPVDPPPGAASLTARGSDAPVVLVDLQDVTALRRSEQMRVDFVANVSHELRTPLTSLSGFIETLRGPARDDAQARDHFLGIMQDQADRMFRLISDLLSLSRIELDEHSRPKQEIAIQDVLTRVIEMLAQKAEKSALDLKVRIDPDLPPVFGDADQLFQVFQNLLDNALKYGAKGDWVEVRATRQDRRRIAVTIADQGTGIPAAHIPRLTERFYRVDAARSRELGGTGLGLAIVKHILNRHRGRLVITSTVGEGSQFTAVLPIATEFRRDVDGDAAAL